MDTVTLVIVIVIVVVVVAAIAVAAVVAQRRRRSAQLREQFGPEYDRAVRDADDPAAAEADLRQREKRHRSLELRSLEPGERDEFRGRWERVQQSFVDDPGRAVGHADDLVVDLMSARGYPADDVDRRAEDLSVAYPVVTQRYREAREISDAHRDGRTDTEDLRHAVTSYRALVDALLDDGDGGRHQVRDGADDRDGPDPRDRRDGDGRRREPTT